VSTTSSLRRDNHLEEGGDRESVPFVSFFFPQDLLTELIYGRVNQTYPPAAFPISTLLANLFWQVCLLRSQSTGFTTRA